MTSEARHPRGERAVKIPIFRVIIKDKLYDRPGGRLIQHWLEVRDAVLFTSDGQVTDNQDQAAYMIARHERIRIKYGVWRVHCPEPYDKELIFKADAGHTYKSDDTAAWRQFSKANSVTIVSTAAYRMNLSELQLRKRPADEEGDSSPEP